MEGEDFEEQELGVAVAVSEACEAADLVVDAFHLAGTDGVVEVIEDAPCMREQRGG